MSDEIAEARRAALSLFGDKCAARWEFKGLDTYRTAEGRVLFHRVRFDPPKGSGESKFIRPIHFDGQWKVGEPPAPPQGKPLYLLPEISRADPSRPVYVVEGEKAARALFRLGQLVTTSGGASSASAADWTPLRGRHVRIWPDHDAPGARYGAEVAALVSVYAVQVEVLDVARMNLPEKGDAHDWLIANPGASYQDLQVLPWQPWRPEVAQATAAPPVAVSRLRTVCMADVQPEPIRWLWPDRIAIGKLTLLSGDPGLGKSMLTACLAAHVTRGRPWPVDGTECPRGSVLLISGEDDAGDTIRPRLDAAEADTSRVHILEAVEKPGEYDRMLCLQDDLHALSTFLEKHPDIRLVVIDPLTAYLGEADSHKNSVMRALLQPLGDIAAKHRVSIIAVSHLNKGSGAAVQRVSGSMAFVAVARASYLVIKDRDDPERRLILPSKNNLAQDTSGLAYRIGMGLNGAPKVEWEAEAVRMTADEALGPSDSTSYKPVDVKNWLRELLANGPMSTKQIEAEADQMGITWRRVQNVMRAARIDSKREGFGPDARYIWTLKGGQPAA